METNLTELFDGKFRIEEDEQATRYAIDIEWSRWREDLDSYYYNNLVMYGNNIDLLKLEQKLNRVPNIEDLA